MISGRLFFLPYFIEIYRLTTCCHKGRRFKFNINKKYGNKKYLQLQMQPLGNRLGYDRQAMFGKDGCQPRRSAKVPQKLLQRLLQIARKPTKPPPVHRRFCFTQTEL